MVDRERDFFNVDAIFLRRLSPSFEKKTLRLKPSEIDYQLAERQHDDYIELLRQFGPRIITLEGREDQPDCNFIEDTSIILSTQKSIILLQSACESRRPEKVQVRAALEDYLAEHQTSHPWTLFELDGRAMADGGDILVTPYHIFVGLSHRSNSEAVRQIDRIVQSSSRAAIPKVVPLHVVEGLHLKSVISILAADRLVLCDNVAGRSIRQQLDSLGLLAQEDGAFTPAKYMLLEVKDQALSNVLRVGRHLVIQRGFDNHDEAHLRAVGALLGLTVHSLDMRELIKADGALTCGSLLLRDQETAETT